MSQVAVTGWGWRTPLGDDVEGVARRLAEGASAGSPITRFPADAFACRRVAALPNEPAPTRHRRFLRRMGCFALEVAREVGRRAPAAGAETRLGLFFAYGGLRAHWDDMGPALAHQECDGADAWARGLSLLHPFWMLQHLSNNAHALASEELGARGDGLLLAGGNAGALAIAAAARALEAGAVDAALVVAYDTLLEPETLVEVAMRGAFTGTGEVTAAYALDGEGFVPGEATAGLFLERLEDAGSRALVLVEAWDAADSGARPALANVIAAIPRTADAGVVDGAALATPPRDDEERRFLAARMDLVSATTPICATLAAMGQLGAAASLVQTIALGSALRARRLPPVPGLDRVAPGPLRPLTAAEPTTARAGLALSTSAPGLAGAVRVELP